MWNLIAISGSLSLDPGSLSLDPGSLSLDPGSLSLIHWLGLRTLQCVDSTLINPISNRDGRDWGPKGGAPPGENLRVTLGFSVDFGACQWDGIDRVLMCFDCVDEVVMSPISIYAGGGSGRRYCSTRSTYHPVLGSTRTCQMNGMVRAPTPAPINVPSP